MEIKNIIKNNNLTKGITLISLVITIVIMLILAAVSINLILGDNGLFNKSKASAKEYSDASDNEQKDLDSVSDELDNMTIEPFKTVKQLIVEVKGPIGASATSSTLNEIEIYNTNKEKINYTISSTEVYDSDSSDANNIPHYWNLSNLWDKAGLNNNDETYSQTSSCGVCYISKHTDDEFTRFLITFNNEEDLLKFRVNFGDSNHSNESPKAISVYRVIKYSNNTYANNIAKNNNEGLILLGTKQFTEEAKAPTWNDIFNNNPSNNSGLQAATPKKEYIVEIPGPQGSSATCSSINELEFYNSDNEKITYSISAIEVYDSDTNGVPSYWCRDNCWDRTQLNDNDAQYTSYSACCVCYHSQHTDTEFTRFLITIDNENEIIAHVKINFGDSNCYYESPKGISLYKVNNYTISTYTNNICVQNNDGLETIGTATFNEQPTTATWYKAF